MTKKKHPAKNSVRERHKDLRLILLTTVTCISLVPTTLLAVLSYYQYQHLIVEEQDQHLGVYADLVAQTVILPLLEDGGNLQTTSKDKSSAVQHPPEYDVFIVNQQGKMRSPSTLFSTADHPTLELISKQTDTITKTLSARGQQLLITSRSLKDANTILIVGKVAPTKKWFAFQFKLVAIFLICTAIGLLLIYQLVTILTRKLRKSDIQRMKVFSDIAHTHRLTTLGKLATGVAHEINNPLAALHQRTGLLHDIIDTSEEFPKQEKVRKTTEQMLTHIKRCQIITHQLLLLAENKSSKNKQTSINALVEELLIFFQEESELRKIEFDTVFEPKLPIAHGEEDKIQQVLLTIITNAMTAIGNNGIIQISTKTKNSDYIEINIEDNGRGIPPTVQKHIFDPFFTTKDTGEGTGLGLAIAHGLINSLGGEITIENMDPKGTRFSILLLKHAENDENTNN